MIDNLVKEHLKKNNVLNNYSNIQEIINFSHFNGICRVPLNCKEEVAYGYLYVEADGIRDSLTITFDDICLVELTKDCVKIIPVCFRKNSLVALQGACDNIILHIYGCSFKYKIMNDFIPKNKQLF